MLLRCRSDGAWCWGVGFLQRCRPSRDWARQEHAASLHGTGAPGQGRLRVGCEQGPTVASRTRPGGARRSARAGAEPSTEPAHRHGTACAERHALPSRHRTACAERHAPPSRHGTACAERHAPPSRHGTACAERRAPPPCPRSKKSFRFAGKSFWIRAS